MRNRTWLAVVAGVAVVVVAVQFRSHVARSKAKAAKKAAAAAAEHAGMSDKVTYAIAMVQGLGDHKVKGKVTFTQKEDGVEMLASSPACSRANMASTFTNLATARWPTANARAATSTRRKPARRPG